MKYLLLTSCWLLLICLTPIASATLSNTPWIPPTNANSRITTSNGTVHEMNYSSNYNFVGTGSATVTASNNSKTVYFNVASSPVNNHQGTYNKTLANNAIVNSGGSRINFINGTNNPVNLVNDPTRDQINVTISSTGGGGGGVTSLNALTGALTIACVSGNTTCTTNGLNTITVNTAWNIVTTGLSAQTITKSLTLNALTLGGNAAGGNKNFTALNNVNATKFYQNGTRVVDTLTAGSGISVSKSGATYTVTNTGLLNGITSVNSQTGPSISVIRQPSYTTITNTTNTVKVGIDAAGVMELNGTQTVTGSKTFSGGITMSGSDINLANNKLKSNNYNWFETTGFNDVSPGFLLQTSASNQQSMLAIAPSGTGTISGVQLLANSTIGSGTWGTYTNLLSGKYVTEIETGTGSLFPWLVRMGTTSLLSFDTANTITSYVSTLFKAKVTQYNSINTAGIGLVPVYASTLQKSETGSADTNVLTYTPPATAGFYRISVNADVSSATSGVIKFTVSYKDANGNTVTDNPIPIFQSGNATPALSFTTSGAGTYQGSYVININNGATNIVVKWAGGGSSAAKVSTTIEQLA